jgi:hypothetical protein
MFLRLFLFSLSRFNFAFVQYLCCCRVPSHRVQQSWCHLGQDSLGVEQAMTLIKTFSLLQLRNREPVVHWRPRAHTWTDDASNCTNTASTHTSGFQTP